MLSDPQRLPFHYTRIALFSAITQVGHVRTLGDLIIIHERRMEMLGAYFTLITHPPKYIYSAGQGAIENSVCNWHFGRLT